MHLLLTSFCDTRVDANFVLKVNGGDVLVMYAAAQLMVLCVWIFQMESMRGAWCYKKVKGRNFISYLGVSVLWSLHYLLWMNGCLLLLVCAAAVFMNRCNVGFGMLCSRFTWSCSHLSSS